MKSGLIRPALASDAHAICEIYKHYILNTVITFEEQAVSPAEMLERMQATESASLPWLVAEQDGEIVGYAYAGRWRPRSAYRHSVESSVYLNPDWVGMGLGKSLYQALLARLRHCSVHVVIGGITLPNAASIALHERLGFVKVAHFHDVGFKFDAWLDVGYWQLRL